ncbi:TetR/AcrR family transcriptional regulator [Actinomadura sp. 3N508]|uniref:TetR/AcrR family transcriptional regulator n=1 Tax=Actinomadura sp. 3N508 TaxID=3375153 RepID=UPI0037B0E31D
MSAAVQMLDEREYEQIQIREVAEEAGVALATLYRYFPSKELLYAHALIEWGKSFEEKVLAHDDRGTTDADRLRAVLKRTVRAYARYPHFYKLITVLEVTTDVAAREVFSGYARSFTGIVEELLHDTDPRDVALVTLVAQSVLGQQLREWSLGHLTLRTVLDNLDDAVGILFGKPRVRANRATARSPRK